MKIRLVTQFFDPEPTLKGYTFAAGLQDRGHEVQVVTGFPNYPSGRLPQGYSLRPHTLEMMGTVPVDRVILYPSHDRSVLRRITNYGTFALSSTVFAARGGWRPDITWVHHPPPTAASAALLDQKVRSVPFIFEIQDLWPDTLTATGMVNSQAVLKGISAGMNRIYASATGLVCISKGFARKLAERGVPESRIAVIHNWADEQRLKPTDDDRRWAAQRVDPAALNVLYAGNMGPAQAMGAVLKACASVMSRVPNMRLHMVGDGLDWQALQAQASQTNPDRVIFHGRQSMGRVAALAELSDFGIVHLRDDPLFEITVPSKTQANMFLGLPMVMAVRGDAADMVAEAGAGLTTLPEDPTAIGNAIVKMAEMAPEARKHMGLSGQSYYMRYLSVASGLDRYEALFTKITDRKGARQT